MNFHPRFSVRSLFILIPMLAAVAAAAPPESGVDPKSESSQRTAAGSEDDKDKKDKDQGEAKDEAQDKEPSDDKKKEKEKPYRALDPIEWGGPEGKDFRLQLGGDSRVRGESRRDFGGVLRTEDDDDAVFIRSRVAADLLYRDVVRAYVQILDARVWDNRYEYPQETHANIQQAFVELGNPPEFTSWSLRLGRQEIEFGRDKRLAESSNWNNIRRTFDGARALYRTKEMDADLFLVNTTTFNRRRGDRTVTERARTQENEFFYGGYATLRQWDPHTIETYFLGLSDTDENAVSENGRPGTSDRFTVGSALYGPLWKQEECGTLGYGLEGAYQFGRRSDDSIQAWMLHADLWYEWEHDWKPRLTALGNLASGDRDPDDGVAGTFNPLFGTSHGPYGIMDFVRLQNLRELAVLGSVNPTEKLKLQLEYHAFWRDSDEDAWYDATGAAIGQGDIGSHIGQEISAVANYKVSECLTVEGGAAHFFSGTAARNSGLENNANFLYTQAVFSF